MNQYYEEIKAEVEKLVEGKVEIQVVKKNNNVELHGLTILKDGEHISPTIYLDHFTCKPEQAAKQIVSKYKKHKPEFSLASLPINSFEEAKDMIVFCLVSKELNEKMLKNTPHKEFLDLAVIYKIQLNTVFKKELATITVTNALLEKWGVSVETLDEAARANTPSLLPAKIGSLAEAIGVPLQFCCKELLSQKIVSNTMNVNGASVILYTDVLKDISQETGQDLIIIPSSIHEVLVMPADITSLEQVSDMVKEVNANELEEMEILSDHAYRYCYETNEISY